MKATTTPTSRAVVVVPKVPVPSIILLLLATYYQITVPVSPKKEGCGFFSAFPLPHLLTPIPRNTNPKKKKVNTEFTRQSSLILSELLY